MNNQRLYYIKKTSLLVSLFVMGLLSSCSSEKESVNNYDTNLKLAVHLKNSRAILTGTILPDASQIGIKLDGETGTAYDTYDNVCYTASMVDSKQVWIPDTDVLLNNDRGTLYAYYPFAENTNLTAIAIETQSQTDYLYATPVTGVNAINYSPIVTMNHVLANIRVNIKRGNYFETGTITNMSVNGVGIATGGTFNAAQTTPDYVADSFTGVNTVINYNEGASLDVGSIDIMCVPTGVNGTLTFKVIVDGNEYAVTSAETAVEKGISYMYTLTLNDNGLYISTVSVSPWSIIENDDLPFFEE